MKKPKSTLFVSGMILSIIITACNKDETTQFTTFRINSEKYFYNNIYSYTRTYDYSNNQLTRQFASSQGWSDELRITYPDINKIKVYGTRIYDQAEKDLDTFLITFSDSRITEFVNRVWYWKLNFTYNIDGRLDKILNYTYYEGVWNLTGTISYLYDAGKLIEVNSFGLKSIISYEGDDIKEIVSSNQYMDSWTEFEKNTFTYMDGKISNKTHFYKNLDGINWDKSISIDYSYDSHGNLLEETNTDTRTGDKTRIEYVYEGGEGNYKQIFDALSTLDYEGNVSPEPIKKSGINILKINDFIKKMNFKVP